MFSGLLHTFVFLSTSANLHSRTEVMNVLAEMKVEDWRDYDPNDPRLQNEVRLKVEERLKDVTHDESPYIFALMGISMAKGLGVCELPSFTVVLSKVYQ